MPIKTDKITKYTLAKLSSSIIKLREMGCKIKGLEMNNQIESAMAFLHHVKNKDTYLFDALIEADLVDDKLATANQLKMKTIARADQLDIVFNNNKATDKGGSKLFAQYIYASYGIADDNIKKALKISYNKYKRNIVEKLTRIKTNKDVLALAQKHPDIDITRLVSYGVVSEKMDYAKEDLVWLDKMIEIIKQGNKQ